MRNLNGPLDFVDYSRNTKEIVDQARTIGDLGLTRRVRGLSRGKVIRTVEYRRSLRRTSSTCGGVRGIVRRRTSLIGVGARLFPITIVGN